MNKGLVLLGLIIDIFAVMALAYAGAVLARPPYTVSTSFGDVYATALFSGDIYASIALVLIGIAIIYAGIKIKN